MPKVKRPRAGSVAFWPKKRAKRIYPEITVYPQAEKARIMAFAGYKAGMIHVIMLDNKKNSPMFGQEISVPATVLDCPGLKVVGIRVYRNTTKGLNALTEVWANDLPKDMSRKMKFPKPKSEERMVKIENSVDKISNIRLMVCTNPRLSGVKKKRPEIFEVEVGGNEPKEKLEFARKLLGREIKPSDFVREGELVDVIAITKGKGTAGPVKRFGIKIQTRKAHKKRRHVGSLGQEEPGKVRPTVPMAGQMGFWRRTELNKRVLKIGEGKEITPKAGFVRYGIVKENYMLIEGSIPGPKKRLIVLRSAIRSTGPRLLVPEIRELVV